MSPRHLSDYEIALLRRFCPTVADRRTIEQTTALDVVPQDRDCHQIELIYPSRSAPQGGYTVLADCVGYDLDGAVIEMLILGDQQGWPHEIEIHRSDTQPLQQLPAPEAWRPRDSA